MNNLAIFAPVVGAVGLLSALIIYLTLLKMDPGNDTMKELGNRIHEGAMVFMKREYSILFIFIMVVFLLLLYFMPYRATSIAFLSGAVCSMLCGLFGMQAATMANSRTSWAASAARRFGRWPSRWCGTRPACSTSPSSAWAASVRRRMRSSFSSQVHAPLRLAP